MGKKELGLLVLIVVIGAITAILNPLFLSAVNIRDMANLVGLFGLYSIGEGLVIITGGIDLSLGSMFALLGVVFVDLLANHDWAWPAALAAVLAGGVALGALQGFLVTRMRLQPFVVTLCGLLIYRGAARYYTDDASVGFGYGGDYDTLANLASGHALFGIPNTAVFLAVVAVIMGVVLHRSVFGRYLYAVGKNEEAARYSGIRTQVIIGATYVISGLMAGFTTVFLVFYTNSVSPASFGSFYELYAIAAAVLGGCSLRGGEGSIVGIVLGTILLQILQNLVNILGIPSSLNFAVMGTVILLGVLTDQQLQRRRRLRTAAAAAPRATTTLAAAGPANPGARMTMEHSAERLREAAGRNLHEKIANALGLGIIGGEHPPGSLLPTEVELCAQLSVSRSALREAFKLLSAKRLIQSRQKVGTLVRPRAEWNMLDPEVLAWHLQAAPSDAFVSGLFEVRKIVEPAAAALAAERRTAETLAPITQALAEMMAAQDGRGNLAGADLRFHQAILDATGNHFLASFGHVIENSLESSFRLSWGGGAHTPDYALRQHHGVMEAIRDGQPTEAHAIMTQLLRSAIEDVRESLIRRRKQAEAAA